MSDVAIRVENVSKSFKLPHEKQSSVKGAFLNIFKGKTTFEKQKALNNINLEINKGEFFGIVGRNGSGKSTLLKMLAGIYAADKGKVHINGKLTPFIELGVGFNPELTGRENVYLNGALLGFNRKQMDRMYQDIVEFAELERFMDQKLKNYSSGMQVRLAFSIAIRAKSDILLIDEVLAVGDALFQKKCFEYFAQLKRSGQTVVFVSHDSDALQRFCDRGVLINNGEVVKIGDIDSIVAEYKDLLIEDDIKSSSSLTKEEQSAEDPKNYRKVQIISCRVNSSKGRNSRIKYREDIKLDIELKVREKVDTLNVAVGIYNGRYEEHADRVFGSSTQVEKVNLENNISKASLLIKNPLLRSGNYLVYVVVFGDSEAVPYDYKWEVCKFEITGAPELKSRGVIMANHNWTSR